MDGATGHAGTTALSCPHLAVVMHYNAQSLWAGRPRISCRLRKWIKRRVIVRSMAFAEGRLIEETAVR